MKQRNLYGRYGLLAFLAVVVTVSFTYAFYTANISNANNPTAISGKTLLSYEDVEIEHTGYINMDSYLLPVAYDNRFLPYTAIGSENNAYSNAVEFTITNPYEEDKICASIYLAVNEISNSWRSEYFKYELWDLNGNTDEIIASGTFEDIESYNDVPIKENVTIAEDSSKDYKIVFWIEEAGATVDQSAMINGTLNAGMKVEAFLNSCPGQQ